MNRSSLLRWLAPLALGLPWMVGCTSETTSPQSTSRLVVSQFLFRNGIDSLEWLELRNDGASPAKMAGIKIKAVGYEFGASAADLPPDGKIILTNSEALFAKHHPGVKINGVYTGRLADEGEKIGLDGAEQKFEFTYSDREPWPAGASAVGASLVYAGGDPGSPDSWSASRKIGGEPRQEPDLAVDKGIRISEVGPADATGSGFVEIASSSSQAVDVSGWILAPSPGASRSDTLAPGTILPARGRIVLRQSPGEGQTGWGDLLPLATGGELLLLEPAPDGGLTGSVSAFAWNVVPQGSSAARIGPTGTESDIATAVPTPGAPTSNRTPGTVSIAEICYAPPPGDAEFVELRNETDSVVHLGFAQDPSRSWSLAGTGKIFAASDSLRPGGTLVLVSESDMTPAAFRAKWGIPDSVPVVAYSGRLDNAGETIRLRRPATPVAGNNGSTSWADIVVDAAAWLPSSPWPVAADGAGACLRRIASDIPGTSSNAWTSAQPTPGK